MKTSKFSRALSKFLLVAGFLFLVVFVSFKKSQHTVEKVEISILGDPQLHFIDEQGAIDWLSDHQISLKGKNLDEVPFHDVEATLRKHPAIESAEIFGLEDGVVRIELHQRKPILRIIDHLGESYYLDSTGKVVPIMEHFTANVPVATGSIREPFYQMQKTVVEVLEHDSLAKKMVVDDLFQYAKEIAKDSFLRAQTAQLFVRPNGEIELIPMSGPEFILLGDGQNAIEKLEKMKLFYCQGWKNTGWKPYASLNLKFHNQIICTTPKHTPNGI